jgi:hypothetical protein
MAIPKKQFGRLHPRRTVRGGRFAAARRGAAFTGRQGRHFFTALAQQGGRQPRQRHRHGRNRRFLAHRNKSRSLDRRSNMRQPRGTYAGRRSHSAGCRRQRSPGATRPFRKWGRSAAEAIYVCDHRDVLISQRGTARSIDRQFPAVLRTAGDVDLFVNLGHESPRFSQKRSDGLRYELIACPKPIPSDSSRRSY